MRKKSPHFHASSSLNMAVRGGLTRFARPAGSLFATLSVCPTGCRQLSNPGRGFSSPRRHAICEKKSPHFHASSSSNMAVRGGLTRFARPAGSLFATLSVCPTGCRQLSNPGRGFSSPRRHAICEKKSPHFHASSSSNMAVRGGFEPPIRCRIHTFQACSFSHSDTSPYCHPVVAGTGANVRKSRTAVNSLFQ